MTDQGAKYTDKELEKMEKKIRDIYSEAEKDMQKKFDEFCRKFDVKNAIYKEKLDNGEITQDQYSAWMRGQVFQSKQWTAKKEQIVDTIHNANVEATKIINGGTISVFAENANWSHYQMEHDKGINFGFGLYDTNAVTNLIKNDPQVLPKWKVNEKKDYKWNGKKVDNAITQGIIQGEGLGDIATRLATALSSNNRNTMLTFARTAMTGAQNAGRNQGLMDAKDLGIEVVKEWVATLDDHTRTSHRSLDGEKQKVGDKWHPFKFSNGCRYPGDPQGPPHEVYNCRCTLVGDIEKYSDEFERYDNINGKSVKGMTYREWKEAKNTDGPNQKISYSMWGYQYNKPFTMSVVDDNTGKTERHSVTVTKQTEYKFPDGTSGGVYAVRNADVYIMDDGTKIIFPSDMDTSKQSATPELMIDRYYQLPKEFRTQMQDVIHVLDYRNPQDSHWEVTYNMKNFRSYATGGTEISFYAYTNHSKNYMIKTFAHEGAHYIDLYRPNAAHISSSERWAKAKIDDLKEHGLEAPTDYAKVANVEDFAESVAEFITNREFMEIQFPHRTTIIKEVLGYAD